MYAWRSAIRDKVIRLTVLCMYVCMPAQIESLTACAKAFLTPTQRQMESKDHGNHKRIIQAVRMIYSAKSLCWHPHKDRRKVGTMETSKTYTNSVYNKQCEKPCLTPTQRQTDRKITNMSKQSVWCACMCFRKYVCMYVCAAHPPFGWRCESLGNFFSLCYDVCVCMYVCMYVYMYVWIFPKAWEASSPCVMIRIYVCMYRFMYAWIFSKAWETSSPFVMMCMYVCMYVCMYEYSQKYEIIEYVHIFFFIMMM